MDSGGIPLTVLDDVLAAVESGNRPPGGAGADTIGLPSLGGENLRLDGTLDLQAVRRVPHDFVAAMRTGHLEVGDVLINKDGAQTGKVARYSGEFAEAAINEHVFLLRGTNSIRQDYLFHVLRSEESQRSIRRLITGSAQPGLSRGFAKATFVFLPSLEEQRRIAEILDTIDDAIHATERVIAKLGDLRSALLAQLALHYADNGTPVPLSSTGDWLSGGTPNTNEPSFWGGPIPWITASSLRGKYLSHSTRTLTAAGVRSGSRIVPPGTLICVVRGMSLKREFRVGIAAVPLAFGQDCKALRTTDDWLPAYLHLQLSARESEVLRLVDEASHGTGRLQMPLLGALLVDRISLNEQQRVVTLFQAHEVRVAAQEAELVKLRQLRAGLAEDLLSGRVRTVTA